jgi:hypothetical protein
VASARQQSILLSGQGQREAGGGLFDAALFSM